MENCKHCVLRKDVGIKNLKLFSPSIINLISVYAHYTHILYIIYRQSKNAWFKHLCMTFRKLGRIRINNITGYSLNLKYSLQKY